MLQVTADSNIYVSALQFGGPPRDFIQLAQSNAIHLTISDDIINEVTRVLRDKFGWSQDALSLFRERVGDFTERVTPTERLDIIKEDPSDNAILECAVAGKSEYLVTRDKHLLKLGTFGGIKMTLVADFLEGFRTQGQGR